MLNQKNYELLKSCKKAKKILKKYYNIKTFFMYLKLFAFS